MMLALLSGPKQKPNLAGRDALEASLDHM